VNVYKHCFFIICLFVSFCGVAQSGNESAASLKRNANEAIRLNDSYAAVHYLELYLKEKPKDIKLYYELGHQYRLSRNYKKAYNTYKYVAEAELTEYPKALFYQAEMEMRLGKYDESKSNYEEFRKIYKGESDEREWRKLAKDKAEAVDTAKSILENEPQFALKHLDRSINKAYIEQSPIFLDQNTVVYVALRADSLISFEGKEGADIPKRKFYVAKLKNGKWNFEGELKFDSFFDTYEISSGSIAPDGNKMVVSACKPDENRKMRCELFELTRDASDWNNPKVLPKEINASGTSNTQPTIANGSKAYQTIIYFVSDRKDGKGDKDIWYSIYDGRKNTYREARNAGMKVNTSQDELTPFYDNESGKLFFSSEGHPGLGGLDVFYTEGAKSKWVEPINIGVPINSSSDELFFTAFPNGIDGWFSSNRPGGVALENETCCDDLYAYKKIDSVQVVISGKTNLDGKVTPGVVLELFYFDSEGEKVFNKRTRSDANGDYKIRLEPGRKYAIEATYEKAFTETHEMKISDGFTETNLIWDANLMPFSDKALVIENINYEFDKEQLTETAKRSIDLLLLPILQNNPTIKVELGSHTDNRGTTAYNQHLSQKRSESIVKYLTQKGIRADRMKAKGYGESMPIALNENADGTDNPEGRAKNRRTEIKVIGTVEGLEEEE
jgi:outer membrane protein OmpA-like peptidoglycan-associated protein